MDDKRKKEKEDEEKRNIGKYHEQSNQRADCSVSSYLCIMHTQH
mgnify:FL=1